MVPTKWLANFLLDHEHHIQCGGALPFHLNYVQLYRLISFRQPASYFIPLPENSFFFPSLPKRGSEAHAPEAGRGRGGDGKILRGHPGGLVVGMFISQSRPH